MISAILSCSKSSTSPSPQPQYSISPGDSWLFQRTRNDTAGTTIDTTKQIVKPETTINNIKFHPVFDTTENQNVIYINASDSIIIALPLGNTYYVISRLIRANVNQGDSWQDSLIIQTNPYLIKIRVKTKVDSVNVSENVPAGTFTTTLIKQKYWYINEEIPIDTGILFLQSNYYINKDVIAVRIKSNSYYPNNSTEDLKLIKYTKAQ